MEVSDTDSVRYQISLSGNGLDRRKLEAASTIRGYASVDFGLLDQGDYTVTVQAPAEATATAWSLPVSVTASGVEVSQVRTFDLRDGINVQRLRYPVNITLLSKSGRLYNEVFRSVQSASHGGRTDMRIARKYIAMQYRSQGIPWYDRPHWTTPSDVGWGDILAPLPTATGTMS